MNRGARDFEQALQAIALRQIPAAIDLLNRAECGGYDPDECAAGRWHCWMLAGEFEKAWQESDQIAARGAHDPFRFWDGQPFAGNRVVIRCLHGFGDAIQFVRYARLLHREAARVLVQTHPQLVPLMRGIPFVDDVFSWTEEGSFPWDQQIEVMELPRAFRTRMETIPGEVPYIFVDPEYRARSRVPLSRSENSGDRPRIGLQWGSGDWNHERHIPLSLLAPLFGFTEFDYFSFQRDPHRAELNEFEFAHRIYDVSGNSPDVAEAAADLMNIDLLITVDTMLAHLAGAIGKPVWLLLPWDADWRWMLDRRDTPWYPTMTLFRQYSPGDWESVVRQVLVPLSQVFQMVRS